MCSRMRLLTNYVRAQQLLDVTNYIDYMMLNFYGANQDWGIDGNWNAIHRRAPGELFKYVAWDGEQLIVGVGDNRVSNTDVPSGLHVNLINSPEYRLTFADRVQKHLFNNGALATNVVSARWQRRASEVDLAIITESARWGDYRRDVHQYQNPPYPLFTRNDYWLPEVNRLVTSYFPQRQDVFLQQLRVARLHGRRRRELAARIFRRVHTLKGSAGTLGTLQLTPVSGPWFFNVDMSLIKRTRIKENFNVEFRADAFNIFNRTNFNVGQVQNINSPTFGQITSAFDPRILQFAVKLNF